MTVFFKLSILKSLIMESNFLYQFAPVNACKQVFASVNFKKTAFNKFKQYGIIQNN
jgi:hypothetical protein